MTVRGYYILLILILLKLSNVHSQQLTLDDVIALAHTQSTDYKRAQAQFVNSHWAYRSHRASYKPQLKLRIDAPEINRTIIPVTQNDGLEAFRERSLANSSANLYLEQNIAPTGGVFFAYSQLSRIDILGKDPTASYLSYPVVVGLRQPVFGFNELKWDGKIQPQKYIEAQKRFAEDQEAISVKATNLFFNLLLSQISQDIHQKALANSDTIFKLSQKRFEIGKIAEGDLLQTELNFLNATQALEKAKLYNELNLQKLKTFLNLDPNSQIQLVIPKDIPNIDIDQQKAITEAQKNRAKSTTLQIKLLEAQKDVQYAKRNSGFQMDFSFSIGFTRSATTLKGVYTDLQDQERFRLSLQIPILDWGRSKASRRIAESNQELVRSEIQQQERRLEQEVFAQVKQWNIYRLQLQNAIKADEIAQKKFEIAMYRFRVGKIEITSLNLAQQDKEEAQYNYLNTLKNIWNSYYTIRMMTMYDFRSGSPIRSNPPRP